MVCMRVGRWYRTEESYVVTSTHVATCVFQVVAVYQGVGKRGKRKGFWAMVSGIEGFSFRRDGSWEVGWNYKLVKCDGCATGRVYQ